MLGDTLKMRDKPFSNDDLENFIKSSNLEENTKVNLKPWEGLDPTAKRTGNRSFTIQLNDYEWSLIAEAAKADSTPKAALIRRAAIRYSKSILELT